MSGFGGLVAASVMALICTVALIFISNVVFLGVSVCDSRIDNLLALTALKAMPEIKHSIITMSGNTSIIKLNVTNAGFQGVRIKDLIKSDIIVIYFNGSTRKAVRLEYSDYEAPNTWNMERVLVGDKEGDLVNPINLQLKTGIWDPGETLEFKLIIQDFVDTNKSWGVVLALPNGVVTTAEF